MRTRYAVSGLTCGACVKKVTTCISEVPHVSNTAVSRTFGYIDVVSDTAIPFAVLEQSLEKTRYRISEWRALAWVKPLLRSVRTFLPLITVFAVVVSLSVVLTYLQQGGVHEAMLNFMGVFFIAFGLLKVVNLSGFARSYRAYDHVAQAFPVWGYIYPWVELLFGVLYLAQLSVLLVSMLTVVIMTQKAYSVFMSVRRGAQPTCACLGGFFSIPITWVTVAEDVLMALMGLGMMVAYVV